MPPWLYRFSRAGGFFSPLWGGEPCQGDCPHSAGFPLVQRRRSLPGGKASGCSLDPHCARFLSGAHPRGGWGRGPSRAFHGNCQRGTPSSLSGSCYRNNRSKWGDSGPGRRFCNRSRRRAGDNPAAAICGGCPSLGFGRSLPLSGTYFSLPSGGSRFVPRGGSSAFG